MGNPDVEISAAVEKCKARREMGIDGQDF